MIVGCLSLAYLTGLLREEKRKMKQKNVVSHFGSQMEYKHIYLVE